jgi:peptide methionine sulfoxide reductase MsrB
MKTTNKNLEAVSPLTREQCRVVTQQDGKERPFRKEYWDNKESGLYVDVVSSEPLFASVDEFDGGAGCQSRPQSRLRSHPPISREECREPLCCQCIRLSFQCGLQPDRSLGHALRLDDDLKG